MILLMFSLPDLPYDYNTLEPYIDEETMRVHHGGHHATYVKNLNDALAGQEQFLDMNIEDLLKSLDQVPDDIRTKVKNNAGGHYHHSIFWTIMKPQSGKPEGEILNTINNSFSDFNSFKEKFNQSASSLFGSGWTWLVFNNGGLEIENTQNQDSPISAGHYPIFGIDLWEHAYYLKYKNKRADFIDAFWNVINWQEVLNRLQKAPGKK